MARMRFDLPDKFHFSTEIPVRIDDINYGGHLGNGAVLSLAHEARIRFFREYGWTELDVEGTSIIMADAAIIYMAEGFHGDLLVVEVAVDDLSDLGCDLLYKLTNKRSGKEIARIKTGIVFFDYKVRKPVRMPESFRKTFEI